MNMKTRHTIYLIVAVIAIVVVIFGLQAYLYPVDIGERTVSVIIEQGDGFAEVADALVAEGVVRSRSALTIPARWRDIDKKLVPGRYDFTGRNSVKAILDKFEAGDFLRVRLTVYEGVPIWRVASMLDARLDIDSARVMALATDTVFCYRLGVPYLEGYLFPETYFIPWGTPVETILADMVAMFRRQTDGIWPDSIPNDLTREEVIVLASIVEAEAYLDEEKPRIASVYHNRLAKNWRLDADPTVIYGLGGLDRPLYRRDLRKRTPYNTYRMKGLPPTPINSPGLAAIKATLNPEETDYFFFVADGSGGHRFSRTNAEHNRARYEIKQSLNEGSNAQ
ncbi:endolytic transglycosylase MltG [candidate division GN15 bacterium]|nr:endolytic transglycosylase MltG [candidate division GN15 bacterium]